MRSFGGRRRGRTGAAVLFYRLIVTPPSAHARTTAINHRPSASSTTPAIAATRNPQVNSRPGAAAPGPAHSDLPLATSYLHSTRGPISGLPGQAQQAAKTHRKNRVSPKGRKEKRAGTAPKSCALQPGRPPPGWATSPSLRVSSVGQPAVAIKSREAQSRKQPPQPENTKSPSPPTGTSPGGDALQPWNPRAASKSRSSLHGNPRHRVMNNDGPRFNTCPGNR